MKIPSTVTKIDATAFSGMRALTSVTLPKNLKKLDGEVFYGCENLKKINFPAKLQSFVPNSTFANCYKLVTVNLSKKNKNYKMKNGVIMTKDGKIMIWAIPAKKDDTNTRVS